MHTRIRVCKLVPIFILVLRKIPVCKLVSILSECFVAIHFDYNRINALHTSKIDATYFIFLLIYYSRQYPAMVRTYPGAANIPEERKKHKEAFYKLIDDGFAKKSDSVSLLTKEKHAKIHEVCRKKKFLTATEFKQLQLKDGYNQAYRWAKKYDVIQIGASAAAAAAQSNGAARSSNPPTTSEVLVYKPKASEEDGSVPALDECQQVSHYDRLFDDLYSVHTTDGNDHPKGRTFTNRLKDKFGASVPAWVARGYTDTCPRCIEKMQSRKPTAGHQPILTKGLCSRGQVDLVDFQSLADGDFKFLMNYQDHGVKLLISTPIVQKRASCVAWALFQIFCLIGPPAILQSDNGREFSNMAQSGSSRQVELDDEFIDEVIVEIKKLWPGCRMVRGSPRRSESNGGIERMNLTVETKLGAWMKDHNSTRWSVGCKIVQWRINTQSNRSVGMVSPYRLTFGQKPRVGISSLPIEEELLETLATEGQLNHVLNIPDGGCIEDAVLMNGSIASSGDREEVGENVEASGAEQQEEVADLEDTAADPAAAAGTGSSSSTTTRASSSAVSAAANGSQPVESSSSSSNRQSVGRRGRGGGKKNGGKDGALIGDEPKEPMDSSSDESSCAAATKWLELADDMEKYDGSDLKKAGLREMFPAEDCDDLPEGNWRRCILVKVRKNTWEVRDETGTEVYETVEATGDKGLIAEWGMYYRRPDLSSIREAKEKAKHAKKEAAEADDDLMVSPRRKRMRETAHSHQIAQAQGMKKRARKIDGEVNKGSIVHVRLNDVDTTKVDSKNLTLVVVEVKEGRGRSAAPSYRLACKQGQLKNVYPRHQLKPVPNATPALMGLQDAYTGWEGLPRITEREAARSTSIVGGQGMVKCNCNGPCDTNRCKCHKAGRVCNSRCHKGNQKCTNHDD